MYFPLHCHYRASPFLQLLLFSPFTVCLPTYLSPADLLKNLIDIITKDEGIRMESIHNHPIFYVKQLPLHNCDLCQDKIKAGAYVTPPAYFGLLSPEPSTVVLPPQRGVLA